MDPDSAAYAPDHPAAIDSPPRRPSPAIGVFEPFPKIPRLNRSMVVTEKIDGSNAAIVFEDLVPESDSGLVVYTQSRKRTLRPGKGTDLNGFAAWVLEHRAALYALLGPGRHFGEWYGQGIQRNYGLDHKRFALFNSDRWSEHFGTPGQPVLMLGEHGIHAVPVLYRGPFSTGMVGGLVNQLGVTGSHVPALPERPFPAEGVIVWHNAARQMFKVTVEGDERPKGSQEPA